MKLTFQVETKIGEKTEKFDIQPSETCGAKAPIVPIDIELDKLQGVWYDKPKGCCPNLEDAGFVLMTTDNVTDIYPGSKKLTCNLTKDPCLANMIMARNCPIKEWVKANLPPKKEEPQGSVLGE